MAVQQPPDRTIERGLHLRSHRSRAALAPPALALVVAVVLSAAAVLAWSDALVPANTERRPPPPTVPEIAPPPWTAVEADPERRLPAPPALANAAPPVWATVANAAPLGPSRGRPLGAVPPPSSSLAGQAQRDRTGGDCRWTPPVAAAVVDPFRPPAGPYAPGNRGIEYGVDDGDPVVAVAPGRVGFRGPVGGRRYLVIHHDNGLRSTYGPMQRIDVVRGAAIEAGDPVGTAGAGFHLTARRGDAYLDPSPFLNGACGRPRLVPVGARPGGVGAGGRGR